MAIENNVKKNRLFFYVFANGIADVTKAKLRQMIGAEHQVVFIDCVGYYGELEKFIRQADSHISMTTYLRFVVADKLPQLKKILHLDCDLIVDYDLEEIWNHHLGERLLAAVEDVGYTYWSKRSNELNLKFKGMNAGVMLINCELWCGVNMHVPTTSALTMGIPLPRSRSRWPIISHHCHKSGFLIKCRPRPRLCTMSPTFHG